MWLDFLLTQEEADELDADRRAFAQLKAEAEGAPQGNNGSRSPPQEDDSKDRETNKLDRERERQRRIRDREVAKKEAEAEKIAEAQKKAELLADMSRKRSRDEPLLPARAVHPLRSWRGLTAEARTEAKRQQKDRREASMQKKQSRELELAQRGMTLASQAARKASGMKFLIEEDNAGNNTENMHESDKQVVKSKNIADGAELSLESFRAKLPVVKGVKFEFCDRNRNRCEVLFFLPNSSSVVESYSIIIGACSLGAKMESGSLQKVVQSPSALESSGEVLSFPVMLFLP